MCICDLLLCWTSWMNKFNLAALISILKVILMTISVYVIYLPPASQCIGVESFNTTEQGGYNLYNCSNYNITLDNAIIFWQNEQNDYFYILLLWCITDICLALSAILLFVASLINASICALLLISPFVVFSAMGILIDVILLMKLFVFYPWIKFGVQYYKQLVGIKDSYTLSLLQSRHGNTMNTISAVTHVKLSVLFYRFILFDIIASVLLIFVLCEYIKRVIIFIWSLKNKKPDHRQNRDNAS